MKKLNSLIKKMFEQQKALTDEIAKEFPIGLQLEVRMKGRWEPGVVTWTPENSNGANPHVYVMNLRTGGTRIHRYSVEGFPSLRKYRGT